jgi:WD40 repeat protein
VTLKYAGILPKPHPLGTDISLVTSPDMVRPTDAYYPDAVAMVYDETSQRVISVYSDRSLYVWDIRDLNKIGKYRSFINHSDCVWGVEPCPNIERQQEEGDNAIPFNSFATFSSDGTIRIWNLDNNNIPTTSSSSSSPLSPPLQIQYQQNGILSPSSSTVAGSHRRNIYSRELVKMIYVDPDAAEFSKLRGNFGNYLIIDIFMCNPIFNFKNNRIHRGSMS